MEEQKALPFGTARYNQTLDVISEVNWVLLTRRRIFQNIALYPNFDFISEINFNLNFRLERAPLGFSATVEENSRLFEVLLPFLRRKRCANLCRSRLVLNFIGFLYFFSKIFKVSEYFQLRAYLIKEETFQCIFKLLQILSIFFIKLIFVFWIKLERRIAKSATFAERIFQEMTFLHSLLPRTC